MNLFDDQNVMYVVRNVLDAMDQRLVDHGQRVAYLVWKIMNYERRLSKEIRIASELALVHDIGAFKTDEIDSLLTFDNGLAWEHSVYGYTFLKYLSPLDTYADCILYHHVPYEKLSQINCIHPYITSLIHLCDRIDVLSRKEMSFDKDLASIFPKCEFDEHRVQSFCHLDAEEHLIEKLRNGTYKDENDAFFSEFHFSENTKIKYLEMLAYSIDFNSEHMVMHTIMTVELSLVIARLMGYNGAELEKIQYGSLLHDIGKVKIPVTILEKEGPLTKAEMDAMREHVTYTEEILDGCVPDEVYQIAVRHHEKLNGTGYPHRLNKDDLTIPQRIVAIADIMSALLGKRSYKDSLSNEETLAILHELKQKGDLDGEIIDFITDHQHAILQRARANGHHMELLYQDMLSEYQTLREQVGKLI